MKYLYLLFGGLQVSIIHAYLVWVHRDNHKWSLSEHVMQARKSQVIYFVSHVIAEVCFVLFSYQLFVVEHQLPALYYLNVAFAGLDFVQALVPSRGKTELLHTVSAYISWCCFLLSGTLAFFMLDVARPFSIIAAVLLAPIFGLFIYMHINRTKIWPYQLMLVPLFVFYILLVSLGAS